MQILSKIKAKKYKKYWNDFKKISRVAVRLSKFVYKILPRATVVFFTCSILTSLAPFLSTWINSLFIDTLINAVSNGFEEYSQRFILLIGAGIGISIFQNLIQHLLGNAEIKIWYGMERDFTLALTRKNAYLDTEHYDNPEMQKLLNKVSQNSSKAQQFIDFMGYIIGDTVSVISAAVILLSFSPLIVLLLMVTSIPTLIANLIFGRKLWGIWSSKGEEGRDFFWTRHYLTRENSLMELRIFRTREYLLERMNKLHTIFQQAQLDIEETKRVQLFLFSLIRLAGRTVTYILIALATIAQRITIGQFNFFVSATGRLQQSLSGMVRRIARIYEHGLFVVDMFEFMDLEEKIVSGDICLKNTGKPPLIELKNVSFEYPYKDSGGRALKNINLTINPGEHLAIVGENGAGKTTLIKLLFRFYDPTEGQILVDKTDLRKIDLDCWYEKIGALFQEFNFYHFSAKENIGVGDPENMDNLEDIKKSAKQAEAHEFISKYKERYNQILNKSFEGGISPSTGQKQKIALARGFFKNPEILILDEPTSAIDPKAEYQIFERLFDFAKEKTVIIISHRFSTVRNANRIIVLHEGKIVEKGDHEELMNIESGKYKTAFELQRKAYK